MISRYAMVHMCLQEKHHVELAPVNYCEYLDTNLKSDESSFLKSKQLLRQNIMRKKGENLNDFMW